MSKFYSISVVEAPGANAVLVKAACKRLRLQHNGRDAALRVAAELSLVSGIARVTVVQVRDEHIATFSKGEEQK